MNSFDIIVNAVDKASNVLNNVGSTGEDVGRKVENAGTKASTALGKVESSSGKAASALGGVAKIAGGFVVANALTGLGGKLLDGARGAAEDEAAMLRLQKAVDNTGTSFDSVSGDIDKAIKQGQDLAFQDGEVANALNSLITATGSTEEGMKRLTAAQDLARGTGMSLEQAAKLLGKASDENTQILKRYGITLEEGATAQDLLNEVDSRFGGQAATFAESGAGQMAKMENEVGELFESLGSFLLPVIMTLTTVLLTLMTVIQTQVIPAIQMFMSFIQPLVDLISANLTPILIALGAAMTVMAVASIPALIAALTAKVAILWASVTAWLATNAAMLPVIAVALAIGVAVAALYVAWQSNFLGIQDITKQVMDFIRPYIETTINAIQTVVETVFPIVETIIRTYIEIYKTVFQTGFEVLRVVVETAFNAIRAIVEVVFPIIETVVRTYIEIYKTIFQTGFDVIRVIVETILNAIVAIFNAVFPTIQGVVQNVITTIQTIIDTGMNTARTIVETALSAIRTVFDTVFVPIQGVVENVWNTIKDLTNAAWNGYTSIYGEVDSGINAVKTVITTVLGEIKAIWEGVWGGFASFVGGIMDGVKSAVSGVINGINGLLGAWNGLEFKIPEGVPLIGGKTFGTPDLPMIGNPFGGGKGTRDLSGSPSAQGTGGSGVDPSVSGPTTGAGGTGGVLPPTVGTPASGDSANTSPLPASSTNAGSGGGRSIGIGQAPAAPAEPPNFGTSNVGSEGDDRGVAALSAGHRFVGCSWQLTGMLTRPDSDRNNDWGLFENPVTGKRYWEATRYCRNGATGPTDQDRQQAASRLKRAERRESAKPPSQPPIKPRSNVGPPSITDRIKMNQGHSPEAMDMLHDLLFNAQAAADNPYATPDEKARSERMVGFYAKMLGLNKSNTYHIYGMQPGDVAREIERYDRREAMRSGMRSGFGI